MPEAFFEPGQRSRCLFTPDLWCDFFHYQLPSATVDFLCDIVPQTVAVVLPSAMGEEGKQWDQVYKQVAQAWGDRRVGFQCQRAGVDAWTSPQPCEGCELVRRAQVVVIDLNGGDRRAVTLMEMAAGSANALQLLQKTIPFVSIPSKKIILINRGEADIPPHYKHAFDYIDYANPQGEADLARLYREMSKLALSAQLFEESTLVLADVVQEDSDAQLLTITLGFEEDRPAAGGAQTETTEVEGVDIRILEMAPARDMPSPAIRQELMRRHGLFQFLDRAGQMLPEGGLLSKAEKVMYQEDYVNAIRLFHQASSVEVQPGEAQQCIELYIKACVEKLHKLRPHEIVHTFFDVADLKGLRDRLAISESEPGNGFHAARVEIKDTNLWDRLNKASSVPLRVYDHLTAERISEWYEELAPSQDRTAFVVAVKSEDQSAVGLQRIRCRDESQPSVHFVELRIEDMKRSVISGSGGFNYVRDQIDATYGKLADPYLKREPVSKDDEFFGRNQPIEQLVERIHRGSNFFIVGRMRSGKTSLLMRLSELPDLKDYLLIYVELPRSEELATHYRAVTEEIRRVVQMRYPEAKYPRDSYPALDLSILSLFQLDENAAASRFESRLVNDVGNLFHNLVSTEALSCQKVVLLLDEFDRLLEATGYRGFLAQIRRLSHPHYPVVLGIVSYGPFMREHHDGDSPAYERFDKLLLGMLTYEECKELVRKIGESNLLYYDEASIRAIFEATGGDPLMTRFLCNEIFRYLGGKGGIVQEGHLEPCVSQCLDARRPHIRRVHSDFLKGYFEDEADVVVQIALKTEVGETMSFKRLQQTFDSLGWDYPRLRDAVDNLKQLELIEEVGTKGKYRIRMGLLHRLLRQEQL